MFSFHSLPHVAVFLSTPSGWRATVCFFASLFGADFYPRPPGGGRPAPKPPLIHTQRFLSTPSGWRATVVLEDHKVVEAGFLSTPSGWRATKGCTASAF